MAPALVDTTPPDTQAHTFSGVGEYKDAFITGPKLYKKDIEEKGSDKQPPASYPHYLPTWNDDRFPPLTPYEHYDHGRDADPSFPRLLKNATVNAISAKVGADVRGVQISQLDSKGKDELALFVAKNRVVAFRNQDFADLPIKDAVEYVRYFGRLHVHPTSGAPAGFPEVHLVHRGAEDTFAADFFKQRTNSVQWHSDVTYEEQPPCTTFLFMLDGPEAGGDTLFADQVQAYKRLSPEFRKRLDGLYAMHSAADQAQSSLGKGSICRREPVESIHPVVRTHPATGEKALYVNPQFTRRIIGFKKEESDYLLKFLYDHLAYGADFHTRVRWEKGTVVCWDNRVTAHSALLDWEDGSRRHLARITPQGERPYATPFESEV